LILLSNLQPKFYVQIYPMPQNTKVIVLDMK